MTNQGLVYITLEWQEQGPLDDKGHRLLQEGRGVYSPFEYPERLSCSNPNCDGGGFEIGERISALLASGEESEQNSLVCRNAVHKERDKRCLHTIVYSIACVRPYQRHTKTKVSDSSQA
jgi:hypothetical protein